MRRWERVDQLLQSAVGDVFPAAQLVVLDGHEIIYETAVGDCTSATLFDIASLTKALSTTTLALREIGRGTLSLDSEARPGVTVRHLLTHSSGLPGWKLLMAGAPWTPSLRAAAVEECRTEPLEAPPGTRSLYSDLGFILLGDLVERAAGQRLDNLFNDAIAAPLNLGTRFLPPDPAACAPTEGRLRGVVHDENARESLGGVAGHAGLFSTARDVATLALALLATANGQRDDLLPASLMRLAWTPSGVPGSTWCHGWDRPSLSGSSAGTLWPRTGVGHLGFTGCSLWLDPPRGRGVILLSNRVHPTRANERIKAFRPLLHDQVSQTLTD